MALRIASLCYASRPFGVSLRTASRLLSASHCLFKVRWRMWLLLFHSQVSSSMSVLLETLHHMLLSTHIPNFKNGICFAHPSSYAFHPLSSLSRPPSQARARARLRFPHAATSIRLFLLLRSFRTDKAASESLPSSFSFPPPKAVVNGELRKTEVFLEAGPSDEFLFTIASSLRNFVCRKGLSKLSNDNHVRLPSPSPHHVKLGRLIALASSPSGGTKRAANIDKKGSGGGA